MCLCQRYDKIWEKLKDELNLEFDELSFLLNKMVEKYFGLKGYSVI